MKKYLLLSILLFAALSLSAEDFTYEYEGQTLTYTILSAEDQTVSTKAGTYDTAGNPVSGDLIIPATVKDTDGMEYRVTQIGNCSFVNCTDLTSVALPESITSIGYHAFNGCSDLTSITIPESVTKIGICAFSRCTGLTTVSIPESVITIGSQAFYYCDQLKEVSLPNSVEGIGNEAFKGCTGLKSVTIPESVKTIEFGAFTGCTNLTSLEFNATNCGNFLSYPSPFPTSITQVTIGENVENLPSYIFCNFENLTSVDIPESVKSIGSSAFYGCTGLTSVEIPESVTSIGSSAFSGCTGLTSINIPSSVTSIGAETFEKCSLLTSVTIPESVKSIGSYAFCQSGLTSITIPSSVESIGNYAFRQCYGLTSVEIPESVTSISRGVFYMCSGLTSVIIPESVTTIGEEAFYSCRSLTSVNIPSSVKSIRSSAFYSCKGLTSVTIPGSVTSIGEKAFDNCTGLESVCYEAESLKSFTKNIFSDDTYQNATLYVKNNPEGLVPWGNFTDIVVEFGLKPKTAELTVGETLQLTVIMSGDQDDKTVTWISSKPEVATVSDDGVVTAIKPGEATITATTTNGLTASCAVTVTAKTIPAESITISDENAELVEGETLTLEATVLPDDTTDKTVTWTSSSTDVATVEGGVVTAVAPGTATITATCGDGESAPSASCTVTVTAKPIPAESISLNETKYTLELEGDPLQLTATILPDDTTDKSVKWTSSNPDVATVDDTGLVTAVAAGDAIITATTANDMKATCTVTVVIPAKEITIDPTQITMIKDADLKLTATFDPVTTTDQTLTWTSSDEDVATVSDEGVVTALAAGDATIIATTANGLTASCAVTVIVPANGLNLNVEGSDLIKGKQLQLEATLWPEDVTETDVTWSSDNPDVATVSDAGLVTATGGGTATITAKTANNLTATCTVTVTVPAEVITLDKTNIELTEGDEPLTLTATIGPDDTTDKSVTWTSSDESVATVDENGVVTAIAAGETIITATTANNLTATCILVVAKKIIEVEQITLTPQSAYLNDRGSLQIKAIITPSDATDQNVTWKSSNSFVAEVSAEGVVRARQAGEAIITATTVNGLTASCRLTVVATSSGVGTIDQDGGLKIMGNTVEAPEGSRIYDLGGREVKAGNLTGGIYIIVLPDGKSVKIAIR